MSRARSRPAYRADRPLSANAMRAIADRIDELLALERYIRDPLRVPELHAMRIAAKRLRYTLEIFEPFYAGRMAAPIAQVKSVQELLGAIHDADVLVPELLQFLRRHLRPAAGARCTAGVYGADLDSALGVLTLCIATVAERKRLYGEFLKEWRVLRRSRFFSELRDLPCGDTLPTARAKRGKKRVTSVAPAASEPPAEPAAADAAEPTDDAPAPPNKPAPTSP